MPNLLHVLLILVLIPNVVPPKKDPPTPKPELPRHLWVNPNNVQKFEQKIPLPNKKRELTEPEKVGLPKDFRQPCVKDPILFQCPCCGFGMSTQVLYKYLPSCPKDGCVMPEVDKWLDKKHFEK